MSDAPDPSVLLAAVRDEVEAVHRFISAWFRGAAPETADALAAGLADRLAQGFINIQPAGRVLERETLLAAIERGHGTNPAFRIAIGNVRLRHVDEPTGLVLATYVETQSGARNSTPPTNARISSVLMRRSPETGALCWLHIHETAVPVGNQAGAPRPPQPRSGSAQ